MNDYLSIYGEEFTSRLILGSSDISSVDKAIDGLKFCNSQIVTVSFRKNGTLQKSGMEYLDRLKELNIRILPHTAGCKSIQEVITLAEASRDFFETNWLKLEIIGDEANFQPDPIKLLTSAETLLTKGFKVLPYCTDDLVICKQLVKLGCEVVMPWASPMGTGKGVVNPFALQLIRQELPNTTLIIDAGIGKPSQAAQAMELGYDAIIVDTAITKSSNPQSMARAMALAAESGRLGFFSGFMQESNVPRGNIPNFSIS
uniref:thiazole synthase n=1 Tax=Candidatus Kentrum sp. DK TaxID=2126562 RepID=A0A450TCA1_9GAMM|nr:MAG: thiazole-phosphate synthase [Candidatus Kentron sp. DK]